MTFAADPSPPPRPDAPRPAALDDIMIAMDVVDMLRHRDDLVRREIDEAGREAELIERLREIYRQQGIAVPDSVLAEGVKALKDSRFTYRPPPPSWARTLFQMWTRRRRIGTVGGAALAAVLAGLGLYHVGVTRPAQLAEHEARIELTQTLPSRIHKAHDDAVRIATDQSAKQKAEAALADGERAIRDRDRAGMTRVAGELERLRADLAAEYTLTIVSRLGETTGVWRRPPAGATQRNYYIIVEPIAPDGHKLRLAIRSEESGAIEEVDKFGVRVPQATYEAVARDKQEDGIVQNNRFGVKRRGTLDVDYLMPFGGGMITRW
jgi:hypothetical protein